MLSIKIDKKEFYDEESNEFHYIKPCVLQLEHSLIAISKWEAKWHKPFIPKDDMSGHADNKTDEELIDYIKCMTINSVSDEVYKCLTTKDIQNIAKYINDPMTASVISSPRGPKRSSKYVTSELIYCWMASYRIPFECEKWHLSRLLTLIRICDVENNPKKNMSGKEIVSRNAAINAARRAKMHSKG